WSGRCEYSNPRMGGRVTGIETVSPSRGRQPARPRGMNVAYRQKTARFGVWKPGYGALAADSGDTTIAATIAVAASASFTAAPPRSPLPFLRHATATPLLGCNPRHRPGTQLAPAAAAARG